MGPQGHDDDRRRPAVADRLRAGLSLDSRPLWLLAIAVRLVAAGLLIFGPWVDEPSELSGWDVARFQEIAAQDGRAWADHPVEYPPGSVVAIEAVAGPSVVETSRTVVVVGLMADLATALFLGAMAGPRAAKVYLVLGLPLVPMGLVRFDTLVTLVAVVAVWALRPGVPDGGDLVVTAARRRADIGFALAVVVAAAIKVWPVLLVAVAWAAGRRSAAALSAAIGGAAVVGWLVWADAGIDPLQQVLSLRGASGWHVESTIGAVVAVFSGEAARLELNAFRIGTLRDEVVLAGRVVAVSAVAALVTVALRFGISLRFGVESAHRPGERLDPSAPSELEGPALRTIGPVALGSVAALLVTAPLLSPQFLIWLTPWAALTAARAGDDRSSPTAADSAGRPTPTPAGLTMAATLITGITLAVFGPPGLDATVPAVLLTARNLLLAAIVAACLVELYRHRSEASPPLNPC